MGGNVQIKTDLRDSQQIVTNRPYLDPGSNKLFKKNVWGNQEILNIEQISDNIKLLFMFLGIIVILWLYSPKVLIFEIPILKYYG